MIEKYIVGDLLNDENNVNCIAHGCNAQGVMGSGVAKAIRAKYPQAYKDYKYVYETSGLKLGSVVKTIPDNGPIIYNCITQEFYGRDNKRYVDYDAVKQACENINWDLSGKIYDRPPIIGIPKIGAGLGGGDWGVISDIINKYTGWPVHVYVLDKSEIPNG